MKALDNLTATTLAGPVPRDIAIMADHVRASHRDVRAVLAYGSCLRGVATAESLIDLYVLTGDFGGVSTNTLSRAACALVPPNVYYAEMDIGGRRARAKYAVLPLSLFAKRMTAGNPYFWARFAQPAALVFVASDADRARVIAAVSTAARTMFANAKGLSQSREPLAVWTAGFAATYATELRAESATRADSLVAANADYYREAARLLDALPAIAANWRLRRVTGKLWSIARLIKAAFTFTGGADYIAWKIERHSGQKIELTAWQRRHPVIAGLMLLPRLLKRGAVR
jgi:hypothetical protein